MSDEAGRRLQDAWDAQARAPFPLVDGQVVPNMALLDAELAGLLSTIVGASGRVSSAQWVMLDRALVEADELASADDDIASYFHAWTDLARSAIAQWRVRSDGTGDRPG